MKDMQANEETDERIETINDQGLLNNAEIESKEAASTDSTQSSDGKGSGGYSADYSQSEEDQSSDDTGSKRKPVDPAASVSGLRISDRKAETERGDKQQNTSSDSLSSFEDTKKHRSSRQRKRALGYSAKQRSETLETENTFGDFLKSLLSQGFLPQLNGMLASHPMDPRIDISNVQYVPEAEIGTQQDISNANIPVLSEENYTQLMDSVRPFFRVPGVPFSEPPQHKEHEGSSSDPVSSEGFTSFFTTTHTGSSNENTTHSADSSDSNKKRSDNKDKEKKIGIPSTSDPARPKRENEGGSGDSSGSSQKRVRILETARSPRAARDAADDNNDQGPIERARFMEGANDSTTSTSSNSNQQIQLTSRFVTDISSSNRTDSAAGTSESAGNTGSASNQGSSGSGADGKGSSEEGKGSSEECKGSSEDNDKRRGDETGGSDGKALGHKHGHVAKLKVDSGIVEKVQLPQGDELREKLVHKKRKRIEMRREYEAQQHFESSESSGYNSESLFRPGKHIQMDQVLQVSNIPRLVIQALPPFLVVHANAAYSRLTGLDAHEVVGKSVNLVLALPESPHDDTALHVHEEMDYEQQTPQDAQRAQGESSAGRSRSERRKDPFCFETLERLIVSCGHGHIQFINAFSVNKHEMVGRNVSFLSQAHDAEGNPAEKDEESRSSNASKSDMIERKPIPCRTAIAPIVSSQVPAESSVQADQEANRRKHHYGTTAENATSKSILPKDELNQHRRHHPPQVITHYVIQLERLVAGGVKQLSVDDSISSNSTSVEARLVGLSKAALAQQKAAVHNPRESPMALGDDEASGSTATSQQAAMVTIG